MKKRDKRYCEHAKELTILLSLLFFCSCGIQINQSLVDTISDSAGSEDVVAADPTVDQTDDDDSSTGFGGGTHVGTIYSSNVLTLNTTTNNSELDESWTPEWSSLMAYWKFDEAGWNGTADEVIDYSGNNNHGVRVGDATTSSANPKIGARAAVLDGTGDYINLTPKLANFSALTEGTIALWVDSSSSSTVMYIGDSAGSTASYFNFTVFGGSIDITMNTPSTSTEYRMQYSISLSGWNHIVFNANSSGNRLFVNGEKVTPNYVLGHSGRGTFLDDITSVDEVFIGARRYGVAAPDRFLNGSIDDFAIWNTALTANEIALLYSRQSAKYMGKMKSRIMDSRDSNSAWTNLDWITTLPFGKELTGSSGNETSSDYSLLIGSSESLNDDDLMDGLIALWHLNETSLNGTSNEVIDSSGNNLHGTSVGNPTIVEGKFSKGIDFDDVDDEVQIAESDILDPAEVTVSAWINMQGLFSQTSGQIFDKGFNTGYRLRVNDDGSIRFFDQGVTNSIITASSVIKLNTWHHVVAVGSTGGLRIYVDGVLKSSNAVAYTAPNSNSLAKIGSSNSGSTEYFDGIIDEVALWSRALSLSEVVQLYRRGANRIKYQVRTCSSFDCSDQDALTGDGWKGPGGNYFTYFSELYNNTNVVATCASDEECYSSELSLQGLVTTSSPSINFSDFTTDGLLGVDNNRYFQYRVIMESDDENTACESGTATCMPELKSVTIGPEHSYEE